MLSIGTFIIPLSCGDKRERALMVSSKGSGIVFYCDLFGGLLAMMGSSKALDQWNEI